MKKFRFTLQPVSTVRDLQEMRAREAFAAAIRRAEACAEALGQQQLRVAEFVAALIEQRSEGVVGPMQVSFMDAYRRELAREREAGEAFARAEKEREAARQRWVEAHMQVKLMDKLRRRARSRHADEAFRAEQRQADDRAPRGDLLPVS